MDKRLAGLIIAAAVTIVGVAWAEGAGAQTDQASPVPWGLSSTATCRLIPRRTSGSGIISNSKVISSVVAGPL